MYVLCLEAYDRTKHISKLEELFAPTDTQQNEINYPLVSRSLGRHSLVE
jgi:hypothetical protein